MESSSLKFLSNSSIIQKISVTLSLVIIACRFCNVLIFNHKYTKHQRDYQFFFMFASCFFLSRTRVVMQSFDQMQCRKGLVPHNPLRKRNYHRPGRLTNVEIIIILIMFYFGGYRCLKHFYLGHICTNCSHLFPDVVSYNRFVELEKTIVVHLVFSSRNACFGNGDEAQGKHERRADVNPRQNLVAQKDDNRGRQR